MSIKTWWRTLMGRDAVVSAAANLPTRAAAGVVVSTDTAVRLIAVYRSIFIITGAAAQLSLDVERAGVKLTGTDIPSYIRRPSLNMSRSDFIEQLVMAMATTGNAYIHVTKDDHGRVISLEPLIPIECLPTIDPNTGVKTVWWRGHEYGSSEIQHLALMTSTGNAYGLGPIEAARTELSAAIEIRDYASNWFTSTGQPAGILSTDQEADSDYLARMRDVWNYLDEDGNPVDPARNPSRIRVLSKGLKYQPIFISPKDAQWIEARQFTTTEIARLFGVPSSLVLAAIEGSSQTYANVEQEWIAFTRFTLTAYLRKIEEALTALAPAGQTVRFNLETLLRSDTKSRYEAHQLAITMGLYSPDYARQIEGIPSTAAPKEEPHAATV